MRRSINADPVSRPPHRLVRLAAWAWLAHILLAGGITASQSALAIALLLSLLAWWRRELVSPWHRVLLPLFLYVIASWISALASERPLFALDQANEWFHFSALAVGIALMRTWPRLREHAVVALAVSLTFLSVMGLWQYFVLGHRTLEQRITGTTAHVMTFSGILLVGSLFLAVLAFDRRSKLLGACAAVALLALALTFTRGAWLGWTAGFAAWVTLRRPRRVGWALPAMLILLMVLPMSLFSRVVSAFDTTQASNFDRIRMAQSGWEMIRDHPLTGVGPGQVKLVYPLYRAEDAPRFRIPHLHNNPIQIWAERGLWALLAVAAAFGVALSVFVTLRSRPAARPWCDAAIASICGFLIAGMFEFNFGDTEVLMILLDVLAIAAVGAEQGAEGLKV